MEQKKILWPVVIAGIIFIGFLIFFLGGGVFGPKETVPPQSQTKLRVLATFFPIYDFASKVGKDRIELDILFTQTPEIASFTPSDIQKINKASIVIKNGLGLEPILDDLIAAGDSKDIEVVDASKGVRTVASAEGPTDPHIWLDPNNVIIQVENIRDAFIVHDGVNAGFYRENSEKYIQELRALDQEIQETVSKLSKKDFIAFHSAFQYLAKRYGLSQAATIEEFPGKEPSPRYLSEVIKLIRTLGITAIFSEPQFSPKVVEVIARDLNLKVYALDPAETGDLVDDSYISIMRNNLEILRSALR